MHFIFAKKDEISVRHVFAIFALFFFRLNDESDGVR